MKCLRLCFILLFVFKQQFSFSQEIIDLEGKNRLHQIAEVESNKYKHSLEKAKLYCKERNLPLTITLKNGTQAYLFGITEANDLLYIAADNQRAASATRVLSLNTNGKLGLSLNGQNLKAGIWEVGLPYLEHVEYVGRVQQFGDEAQTENAARDHAAHVIGTVAGTGINLQAKGMASLAQIDSYSSSNDASEMANAGAQGLLISNHSYGFLRGWGNGTWRGNADISNQEDYLFGFYDNQSRTWDNIALNAPHYLIVKSAGNERGDSGNGNFPADCNRGDGFDCIAHGGLSKNVLTVGAVNVATTNLQQRQDVIMSDFSSWGPTDDGRIKPDIVGVGVNVFSSVGPDNDDYGSLSGTSMAAPNVAGSLLLLQEYFYKLKGEYMLSSSVKALAIHTAFDAGLGPGPDYTFGWGLLNSEKAAILLSRSQFDDQFLLKEDTLFQNSNRTYKVNSLNGQDVVVTICWTDPAGTPVAPSLDPNSRMLVNDLDLRVISPSGVEFFPWKLNGAQPSAAATKGDNDVDNIEKIEFQATESGEYSIVVRHKANLASQLQVFSLVANVGSIVDQADETLFWIGANGTWDDANNWSFTRGGIAANKIPTSKSRVIIPDIIGNQSPRVISITSEAFCQSLTIEGTNELTISFSNQALHISENLIIKNSKVKILGNARFILDNTIGSTSLVDLSPSFSNADFEIVASESSTYNILSNLDINKLILKSGILSVQANKILYTDTLMVENNGLLKKISFENGVIDSIRFIDISSPELIIEAETIKLIVRENEKSVIKTPSNQVVEVVNFSADLNLFGFLFSKITNYGGITNNESANVASLMLEDGSKIRLRDQTSLSITDSFIINSTESNIVTIESVIGSATINISITEKRRLCFDHLMIHNVEASGETQLFTGLNSELSGNTNGWVFDDCSFVLFADFIIDSPCAGGLTSFNDLSTGTPTSWLWNFGDPASGLDNSSTEQNASHIYATPGNYLVSLTISDGENQNIYQKNINVIANTLQKPEILLSSGFVFSSRFFSDNYQWYLNNEPIVGATSRFLNMDGSGLYQLEIRDQVCSSFSEPFIVTDLVKRTEDELSIYPNPTKDYVTIEMAFGSKIDFLILQDLSSRQIHSFVPREPVAKTNLILSAIPKGIYILKILSGEKIIIRKIILE